MCLIFLIKSLNFTGFSGGIFRRRDVFCRLTLRDRLLLLLNDKESGVLFTFFRLTFYTIVLGRVDFVSLGIVRRLDILLDRLHCWSSGLKLNVCYASGYRKVGTRIPSRALLPPLPRLLSFSSAGRCGGETSTILDERVLLAIGCIEITFNALFYVNIWQKTTFLFVLSRRL